MAFLNHRTALLFEIKDTGNVRLHGQDIDETANMQGYKLVRVADDRVVATIERAAGDLLSLTYTNDKDESQGMSCAAIKLSADIVND